MGYVLIHSSVMETASFSVKALAQKIHSWSPWKTGDWILLPLSCFLYWSVLQKYDSGKGEGRKHEV